MPVIEKSFSVTYINNLFYSVGLQFEEIHEKYLRPKALTENLDNSSWNDKTQIWVRSDSSSADTLAFIQGTILGTIPSNDNNNKVQVKLFNGKVGDASKECGNIYYI